MLYSCSIHNPCGSEGEGSSKAEFLYQPASQSVSHADEGNSCSQLCNVPHHRAAARVILRHGEEREQRAKSSKMLKFSFLSR